jgi:hypothetical protein
MAVRDLPTRQVTNCAEFLATINRTNKARAGKCMQIKNCDSVPLRGAECYPHCLFLRKDPLTMAGS